jgi:hypothetical protein
METVKSVLVVGGGTAGLISAIILKIRLDITVDVVHSKNIGIIGVGEGSTEHWQEFMTFVGIDHHTLIKEADATYKSGIMFENWGSKDYLHSVASPLNSKTGQYHHVYAKQISQEDTRLAPEAFWKNRIDKRFLNNNNIFPANQFHFNTHKLNDFLIKIAKSLGINIIEDDIEDINLDENGYIDNLKGIQFDYKYDFYIDSTGFKRILISKLGGKWQSYSKYLKMKSAITFQTEDEDNYNFWTVSRAMDYGWMFKIPVWGRHGNGYIFDSDYINADQAQQEVETYLGKKVNVNKQFNFDPGCLEEVWIKNCCAIGVSANFIEPLEASSIGTSIQQSFLLMHRLGRVDNDTINSYNKSVNDIMENARDFIALHYMTDKADSIFWKDLKKIEIPNTLKSKLELWKNRLPIREDFKNLSDYILFKDPNFILVMEGLNLFNRDAIKDEYSLLNSKFKEEAEKIAANHFYLDRTATTFSHKEYIKLIRDNF